ncbi:MAG: hypothetical protein QXJ17_02310 [Nitrososphaeria archaeon]
MHSDTSLIEGFGVVESGVNIATATIQDAGVYDIILEVGEIIGAYPRIEVKSPNGWLQLKKNADLFKLSDELRVIFCDNTGSNLVNDKPYFYNSYVGSPDMMGVGVFSIPLRLHIKRFLEGQLSPLNKGGNLRIEVELLDPDEDINSIDGVRQRSGKEFVELFHNEILNKFQSFDNCPEELAPSIYALRSGDVGGIKSDKMRFIFFVLNPTLSPSYSYKVNYADNKVIVSYEFNADDVTGVEDLVFEVLFNPPGVLGNNYKVRVNLVRPDTGEPCSTKVTGYETPKITVWRETTLELFLQGEDLNDKSLYDDIEWDEVQRAFEDAYIIVNYPKKPSTKTHVTGKNDWIMFLENFVYNNWRTAAWNLIKNKYPQQLSQDLRQYSFPQRVLVNDIKFDGSMQYELSNDVNGIATSDIVVEGVNQGWSTTFLQGTDYIINGTKIEWQVGNIVPDNNTNFKVYAELAPTTNSSWETSSYAQIEKMAYQIVSSIIGVNPKDSLPAKRPFYVLVCKPPTAGQTGMGCFLGGKLFYIVTGADSAQTFTHEMGHALFLNHGSTSFIQSPSLNIVVQFNGGGSSGPFWHDHDSEDMISCVMSYCVAHKLQVHPCDWHFCGVCLLLLKFYDGFKLQGSDVMKKLQYSLRKGNGPIRIISADYQIVNVGASQELQIGNFNFTGQCSINSESFKQGAAVSKILFVAYPKEGVINNTGVDYFKDISSFPWHLWKVYDDTTGQEISPSNSIFSFSYFSPDARLFTMITLKGIKGRNRIVFEVNYNSNNPIQSEPFIVEVV